MSSIHSIHHGTISAKPLSHGEHAPISGDHGRSHGRIGGDHGKVGGGHGKIGGHDRGKIGGSHSHHSGGVHGNGKTDGQFCENTGESQADAAMAEISNLIASLGSLSSQAQSMPLTPPTLPGLPQGQGYQMQPADYAFGDEAN